MKTIRGIFALTVALAVLLLSGCSSTHRPLKLAYSDGPVPTPVSSEKISVVACNGTDVSEEAIEEFKGLLRKRMKRHNLKEDGSLTIEITRWEEIGAMGWFFLKSSFYEANVSLTKENSVAAGKIAAEFSGEWKKNPVRVIGYRLWWPPTPGTIRRWLREAFAELIVQGVEDFHATPGDPSSQ